MNLPVASSTKNFRPCPALIFFDMSTSAAERRYKRAVLPDAIPNEQHAKQLEEIEHRLWVLCHHFKVFPEEHDQGSTEPPEEKPPEPVKPQQPQQESTSKDDDFVSEIVDSVNPARKLEEIVEGALRRDNEKLMADIGSRQDDFLRRMFELAKMARVAKQAEEAQTVGPAVKYDFSYSALTEITTTMIKIRLSDSDTTTVHDQYGIPWKLRFRQDIDWLVLDVDTSGCSRVMGRFKILVRFIHESPLKNYPSSVPIDVNHIRTIYCGTLGSVTQLQEDGYFAKDGTLQLKVAVVPMDPDAERSTHLLAARLKKVPPNPNMNKMPKFSEGQLTIADFSTSRTTYSPKILDAQRNTWQLVVMLNQNLEDRHRKHMSVGIKRLGSDTADTCYEYFIELLPVNPDGWPFRQSGRMLEATTTIPEFIIKSRAEIYLKDDKLRIRWGVRRLPIR